MLREPHQNRLVKARVNGKWCFVSECQFLPDKAIRIKLEEGTFLVPAEDWYEVADVPEHVSIGSSSDIDLTRIKPDEPRARTRLRPDPIPASHVALGFILLIAGALLFLILAVLMERSF